MAAVANAWMPGAGRIHCTASGGLYRGGAPRAVWLTTEADPATHSARAIAERYEDKEPTAHLVWNPVTGETVQLLPATVPAIGRLGCDPDPAREGRICLVIEVVGHAEKPFTDRPLTGIDPILSWLDSWEVARTWPAGPPPPADQPPPQHTAATRLWALGGHFGHSQVPGSRAIGPGAISPDRLLGSYLPGAPGKTEDHHAPATAHAFLPSGTTTGSRPAMAHT
ncbi:hypothetical protein GCM10009799_32580 [Nocardiopsis rhodophaea]|uniref:Uncharacterized protein n=1 Tax=Nocardiopsis rhodophaea TaxID=280238 RepID=A0ABP5ERI3_9ACTN